MKNKYLLLCILLYIIIIGLIPFNVWLLNFNMPEFANVISTIIVIVATILVVKKTRQEKYPS